MKIWYLILKQSSKQLLFTCFNRFQKTPSIFVKMDPLEFKYAQNIEYTRKERLLFKQVAQAEQLKISKNENIIPGGRFS